MHTCGFWACVCVVLMCKGAHSCACGVSLRYCSSGYYLIFEMGSLTGFSQFMDLSGLAGQDVPTCPWLTGLGLEMNVTTLGFFTGVLGSNSGLHASVASTLPTEPSPQLQ